MAKLRNKLGEKIRKRRKELGYKTQEALADKLDVDVSRISRWETGDEFPDTKHRANLFEILKMNDDFSIDQKHYPTFSDATHLLLAYGKAKPHIRQKIDELLSLADTSRIDNELDSFADQVLGPRESKETKES